MRFGECGICDQGENSGKVCRCDEPASSGNSELLLRDHVEAVTKAILFEDCGNTQDWQDNTELGEAAIRAYRPVVQAWRNDALESAAKIAERYAQTDVAAEIRKLLAQ